MTDIDCKLTIWCQAALCVAFVSLCFFPPASRLSYSFSTGEGQVPLSERSEELESIQRLFLRPNLVTAGLHIFISFKIFPFFLNFRSIFIKYTSKLVED